MRHIPAFFLFVIAMLTAGCEQLQEDDLDAAQQQTLIEMSYGSGLRHRMDVALPAGRDTTTPVVIFIHGGAWVFGDKSVFADDIAQYAAEGIACATINYRYASELAGIGHPDIPNDVRAAIDHIVSKSGLWQVSPTRFGLVGHSAGGHLALQAAYTLNSDGRIKACASWAGPVDFLDPDQLAINGATDMFRIYTGTTLTTAADSALYREASPQHRAHADVPPTLIVHGTVDDIVPYLVGQRMKLKLDMLGAENSLITLTGQGHGWTGQTLEHVRSETLDWFHTRL
ncbi:MAG: alpha/beta hydrolase [Flavobacteriales bacterium]|nr:alpha/beta hydrolase [Flavobacteriales bacterium]